MATWRRLRDRRQRDPGRIPMSALLILVSCLAGILATAGRSSTAAQGRLAALPAESPAPPDNPSTPERVALGRLLFWDPILSGQKDVACATCHHPAFGYSDGLDLSIGANGAGLGAGKSVRPGSRAATGEAQQPDGAERRVQRPHGRWQRRSRRPRRCSGISGCAASKRRRWSRSRRWRKCAARRIRRTVRFLPSCRG